MSQEKPTIRYPLGERKKYEDLIDAARERFEGDVRVFGSTGEREISIEIDGRHHFGESAVLSLVGC